jgi:hypothetical protein
MEVCPICLEDMDMLSFRDERQTTATCYKLECGHAYHTKCIIQTLSQSERKCPSCNGYKDPITALTEKGAAMKLITEIKKSENVRISMKELNESILELNDTIKTLKSDTKAYIAQRSLELNIPQKRKYLIDCLASVRRNGVETAKKLNPKYDAAFKVLINNWGGRYFRGTSFERMFYGPALAYSITRSKYPRLWTPLY